MSVQEELHEHAQHAHEPFDKRVAATMAIIAAVLAIVSVLGHISATEEIVLQQRAADQWAFSQAKNIRRYDSEIARDVFRRLPGASAEVTKYEANLNRYERETNENQDKARELEAERDIRSRQALRLEFGEVFLEISIVFASLAILSKRRELWFASVVGSAAGLVIASSTALIR